MIRCKKCQREYEPKQKFGNRCPYCGHKPGQRLSSHTRHLLLRVVLGLFGFILPLFAILTGHVIIVGMLLSFALGGFMFYSGIRSGKEENNKNGLRFFMIAFGLVFLLAGVGLLIYAFNGAPIPGWREMRPIFTHEAFIGIAILTVFGFAGHFVKRLLDKMLWKRIKKQKPDSWIFAVPSYFTTILIAMIMILIAMDILMMIAGISSWLLKTETGLGLSAGIGVPLILSPFLLFAILMVRHNSGAVALNTKDITRYHYFSKKCLHLSEIKQIKPNAFGFPMALALKSARGGLRFPTAIKNYPTLIKLLKQYTGLSFQKPPKKGAARHVQEIRFPYIVEVTQTRMALEYISLGILILIYLGIALAGLWILLLRNEVPPFTMEDLLIIGFIFVLVSLIFGSFTFIIVKQTLKPKNPTRIILNEGSIRFDYGNKKQKTYPAADLKRVWLQPVKARLRSSYGGAVVRGETTIHKLHLKFSGEDEIILTRSNLSLLRTTPEALLDIFQTLYPHL